MTIKEIVTLPAMAKLAHVSAGILYYEIKTENTFVQFQVDMNDKEDVGDTTFYTEYKPITLMRYIRKSMDNGTLVVTTF